MVKGMQKIIRVGSRGSRLALKQVELFVDALRRVAPEVSAEVVVIQTAGDQRTDLPLCQVNRASGVADKGVFIAAIEEALLRGEIDCAVHSCKDMPGKLDDRMCLAAVLPREVPADTLVIRPGADMRRPVIGTSSVRRAALAKAYWGGAARVVNLRGNVPTRLLRLAESQEMDAIILARAGLSRLGLGAEGFVDVDGVRLILADLSCDAFMPALCQGAIAIETLKAHAELAELLRRVNHEPSELTVRAERAFLAALQADCSTPVAGYASLKGSALMLRVLYFMPDGLPIRLTLKGSADQPEALALRAAADLRSFLAPA